MENKNNKWWDNFISAPLYSQIEMGAEMGWTFKKEYVHSHSSDTGEVYSMYHVWIDKKGNVAYSEWVGEVTQ